MKSSQFRNNLTFFFPGETIPSILRTYSWWCLGSQLVGLKNETRVNFAQGQHPPAHSHDTGALRVLSRRHGRCYILHLNQKPIGVRGALTTTQMLSHCLTVVSLPFLNFQETNVNNKGQTHPESLFPLGCVMHVGPGAVPKGGFPLAPAIIRKNPKGPVPHTSHTGSSLHRCQCRTLVLVGWAGAWQGTQEVVVLFGDNPWQPSQVPRSRLFLPVTELV